MDSLRKLLVLSFSILTPAMAAVAADVPGEVTLIHMGDIHGHLVEHPNVRSDGHGEMMGGLARIYTLVQDIRRRHPNATVTVNSGDTVQGSAEALFTQGEAVIKVLNEFGIDTDNPGNWDYLYGTEKFLEQFAGANARFRANAIAANLYYDGAPYADRTGDRVLPPYWIKEVNGVKIGFVGYTASRGPQAVKTEITKGFRLTDGEREFPEFIHILRDVRKVDVVVAISELGLAANIDLASRYPGVDVILSSDMHETTPKPVHTRTGTWIIDEGQDGQVLNELTFKKSGDGVALVNFKQHQITAAIKEDPRIATIVKEVRAPFVSGPGFVAGKWINPMNGLPLTQPIDTVVGYTDVPLYRGNFSDEAMPAVLEGSSHDFLTDAFKAVAGTEVGIIRGFRYGTHVAPGPIRMEDIYHFVAIGPVLAKGMMTGHQISRMVEDSAFGCFTTDVGAWSGGWVVGLSGVTLDFDPYGGRLRYASNIKVGGAPLDDKKWYSVAGYFFAEDPQEINRTRASKVEVLRGADGKPLDGVAAVAQYLKSLPGQRVTEKSLTLNRYRLVKAFPPPAFGNREIQPLNGVPKELIDPPPTKLAAQ